MNLSAQLDLMLRTHRAARELRLVNARIRAAEAIGDLLDQAARELTRIKGVQYAALRRAVDAAERELRISEQETRPAQKEMS